MAFPKDLKIDANLLSELLQAKKADLARIDLFMNEFDDWYTEYLHEAEDKFQAVEASGADRPLMDKLVVDSDPNKDLFTKCE